MPVYLLDTDHMSLLRRGGANALRLEMRLIAIPETEIVTCVIVYEEQCKGWRAKTSREKEEALLCAYVQSGQHLEIYARVIVLPYDVHAHALFRTLQIQKFRIGTQNLKIAAIALANNATVLTRNTSDFARIPNLLLEDWSV